MDINLKPCPFCGGTKLKIDSKKSNDFHYEGRKKYERHVVTVRCNKCHTRGPTVSVFIEWMGSGNAAAIMEAEAAEAWNGRADAEPVRHGRWIENGDDDMDAGMWHCSECGHEIYTDLSLMEEMQEQGYALYCEHCGAKMDDGKDINVSTNNDKE